MISQIQQPHEINVLYLLYVLAKSNKISALYLAYRRESPNDLLSVRKKIYQIMNKYSFFPARNLVLGTSLTKLIFTPKCFSLRPLANISSYFSLSISSRPLWLQTKLLTQYILNLGKYDQNYDIRDRTRFIRQLIVPNEKSGALNKYARRILLAPKPAPVLESAFKGTSYICNISPLSLFWKALNPPAALKVSD